MPSDPIFEDMAMESLREAGLTEDEAEAMLEDFIYEEFNDD